MKHKYEIKLADGDIISYISEFPIEEFKKYIASNDFIEIERNGKVPYGNGGWRRVPKLASYQTKSIVYIEEYSDYDTLIKEQEIYIAHVKSIVSDILKYEPNRKMKLWLYFEISTRYRIEKEDDWLHLPESLLCEIKSRLIRYGCKIK